MAVYGGYAFIKRDIGLYMTLQNMFVFFDFEEPLVFFILDCLAAFMMASILLNPQLIVYSTALGAAALLARIASCAVCGLTAGLLVFVFYGDKPFFNFSGFQAAASHDTAPTCFSGSGKILEET